MNHDISRMIALIALLGACATPPGTSHAKDSGGPEDAAALADVPDTSADLLPAADQTSTPGQDAALPDWSGCPAKPDAASDALPDVFLPPCATETDCAKVSDQYCTQPHCVDGHCRLPGPECCDPAVPGAQCSDNRKCTTDECVDYQCIHILQGGCECLPGDFYACDDNNICTIDACAPNGECVYAPNPGCCNEGCDCDDGDPCTKDACNILQHMCSHTFACGPDAGP